MNHDAGHYVNDWELTLPADGLTVFLCPKCHQPPHTVETRDWQGDNGERDTHWRCTACKASWWDEEWEAAHNEALDE